MKTNGIELLLIGFMILFLIERKTINILINYIGVTVLVAILIGANSNIQNIEGEYIAYIIILVQISALTILFGFIIMLYPSTPTPYFSVRIMGIGLLGWIAIVAWLSTPMESYDSIITSSYSINEGGAFNPELARDLKFLRKLGEMLFTDNDTIIKLMLLGVILFIAIVVLFFLIKG